MGATTFLSRRGRDEHGVRVDPATGVSPDAVSTPTPGAPRNAGRALGGAQQWTLAPGVATAMPAAEVQDLWIAMRRTSWRSVAIVPTVARSVELELAEQLVVVGVADTGRSVTLVSARGVGVAGVDDALRMVRTAMMRAELVVVVVDPVDDNPATAAVLRSLDAVVLVARLGASKVASVERSCIAAAPARLLGVVTRS